MTRRGSSDISVALCTFNGRSTVLEQLSSIAAQTRPPAEIVIGDDGSSDDTVELIQAWAKDQSMPVRVTVNPVRLGFAENFLATMRRCQGALIALSDQDDVWSVDKLATLEAELESPGVMGCVHDVEWVDPQLRPLAARRRLSTGVVRRAASSSPWFVAEGSRLIFRKRLLDAFDTVHRPLALDTDGPDHPAVHDEWATFAATSLGELHYLPVVLGKWRRHDGAYGFARGAARQNGRLGALQGHPPERLTHRTRVCVSRLEYLTAALATADRFTADELVHLRAQQDRYRRLIITTPRRTALSSLSKPVARLPRVAGAALTGVYGRQARGGHGWLGLVQDVVGTSPPPGPHEGTA